MARILPITPTLLAAYKTCPLKYKGKYITKEEVFVPNEAADFGNSVHSSVEESLKLGTPLNKDASPLMQDCVDYLKWLGTQPGFELHIEKELAITRDLGVTTWKAKDVWMRGKADVFIIDHNTQRNIIIDWKTGKVKDDPMQAQVLSLCATVTTKYVDNVCAWAFVKYKQILTPHVHLGSMAPVATLLADATAYENACKNDAFPPTPNGLCGKWCGVLSCPYNGKNT